MGDCVKREDIINALHNIGGCGADIDTWAEGWDKAIDEAIRIVQNMPAADVVEVVRCNDCLLHGNCTTEDSFIFSGLFTNKCFCCVGKRKGADNG